MVGRVYSITCLVNGKVYVGQTVKHLNQRWSEHVNEARLGCGRPLYQAIRKYGKDQFVIALLQECNSRSEMNVVELEWGLKLNALLPQGYSLRLGDASGPVSQETRELRRAMTGRVASSETRAKLSLARKQESEETKKSRSLALKATFASPEVREACRSRTLGNKASEEAKAKMSCAAKKRSPPVVSFEVRSAAAKEWQRRK